MKTLFVIVSEEIKQKTCDKARIELATPYFHCWGCLTSYVVLITHKLNSRESILLRSK